jgi:hypothetical protein
MDGIGALPIDSSEPSNATDPAQPFFSGEIAVSALLEKTIMLNATYLNTSRRGRVVKKGKAEQERKKKELKDIRVACVSTYGP